MAIRDYLSPENIDKADEERFKRECLHPRTRVVDLTVDRLHGTVECADCGAVIRSYCAD